MWTLSRALLFSLAASTWMSGCSVYRNKGRDQFEARADGNVKTEIGAALAPEDAQPHEDSCWMQSANEALWSAPVGSSLHVRRMDASNISVCLSEIAKNGDEHHE